MHTTAVTLTLAVLFIVVVPAVFLSRKAVQKEKSAAVRAVHWISRTILAILILMISFPIMGLTTSLLYPLHRDLAPPSMVKEVKTRLDQAGGVEAIRVETRRLFAKIGRKSVIEFSREELRDYPALQRLGQPIGMLEASAELPACVRVGVGGHGKYSILFFAPDNLQKPSPSPHRVEINDFVYVAR